MKGCAYLEVDRSLSIIIIRVLCVADFHSRRVRGGGVLSCVFRGVWRSMSLKPHSTEGTPMHLITLGAR
jgi:hypothetical protein